MSSRVGGGGWHYRLILASLSLEVSASDDIVEYPSASAHHDIQCLQNQKTCGFVGNYKLYGPGIRVCLYLQTLALFLGSSSTPRVKRELHMVSTLSMSAMLISLVIMSATPSFNYAAEAFVLLHMVEVAWYNGPAISLRTRPLLLDYGLAVELLNSVLTILLLSYSTWFWWTGMDQLQPTPCGTYVFTWAYRFDLYGFIRLMNKMLSLLSFITGVPEIVYHAISAFYVCRARRIVTPSTTKAIKADWRQQLKEFQTLKPPFGCESAVTQRSSSTDDCPTCPCSSTDQRTISCRMESCRFQLSRCEPAASNQQSQDKSLQDLGPLRAPILHLFSFHSIYTADRFIDDVIAHSSEAATPSDLQSSDVPPLDKTYVLNSWILFIYLLQNLYSKAYRGQLNCPTILLTSTLLRSEGHMTGYFSILRTMTTILEHEHEHEHQQQQQQLSSIHWLTLTLLAWIRATRRTEDKIPASHNLMAGAVYVLSPCVIRVMAIEATLGYNIAPWSGGFWDAGQLVPFFLGAGCLIRVLYSEVKDLLKVKHGTQKNSCEVDEVGENDNNSCAEAYYALKTCYEQRNSEVQRRQSLG